MKKLEQYISFDTKRVKSAEFDIAYDKQLFCRLILKRSYLRSIMETFTGKGFSGTECIVDKNGNYCFNRDVFGLKINKDNIKDFNKQAALILNSEFANKMNFSNFINTQTQNNKKLNLNIENSILQFSQEKFSLKYQAKSDSITYLSPTNKNLSESLNKVLTLEIPKKDFSSYQQEIIENSDALNKEVRVVGDITDKTTKLQIFEDDKEFVLQKIMK